jgi:hypothetical protein
MKSLARLVFVGFFAIVPILAIGCADEKEPGAKPPPPPPVENAYVGAAVCATCHSGVAATVGASLHPRMVTVVTGQLPPDPPTLPENPPGGRAWSDIKYVLGGWGWTARFVTQDMQVVVGENAQFNVVSAQFPGGGWAPYHVGEPTPYNYACFRCHTTGANEAAGTFAEPGVQCEACHGMGKLHAESPPGDIVRDPEALSCATCHLRDPERMRIFATRTLVDSQEQTFIDNQAQWDELKDGPHAAMKCTECHDPHKGIRRGQVGGIVQDCQSAGCHPNKEVNHYSGSGGPRCIDCHMSRATRNARSVNKYEGDLRTHIFKIHDGPEGQADMFETVGANIYVKQGYGVTLDYACYSCHQDESGVGNSFGSKRTLAELRAKALIIHPEKVVTGK